MKATRIRTLRGTLTSPAGAFKQQLILDDGRPNNGLKILEFHVWSDLFHQQAYGSFGLSLDKHNVAGQDIFDAGDNRQIAWVTMGYVAAGSGTTDLFPQVSLIDPDHIVNRDLFIYGLGSHDVVFNYLIKCQEVELTDDEAIVTIIKETSQNTTH